MGMLQDAMDRRDVQDIVHEALGRQLRLAMVAGVLMIVVGFVLGHYVAAAHARLASDRLEQRIDQLIAHVGALQRQSLEQQAAQRTTLETLASMEQFRRDQAARDREALRVIIAGAQERRTACLRELEPFAKRRLMVPAPQVVAVVSEFVDRQVGQVQQLLAVVERRAADIPAESDTTPPVAPPPPSEPMDVTLDSGTSEAAPPYLAPRPDRLTIVPDVMRGLGARAAAPLADGPAHFAPAQRAGYLFFSPTQPRRLEEVRVADPDVIPLPPR